MLPLSPELLSQCPAHGLPPLAQRLVEGKEAHLFLFAPPGENPIDVAGPARFLGLAVGEAHEPPALCDRQPDLRYQYSQQSQRDPQRDRGEHGRNGEDLDAGLKSVHGREEEPIDLVPRGLGAFQTIVKRAYLKEDERQP